MAEYSQEQYDKSIEKLKSLNLKKDDDFSLSNAVDLKNLANKGVENYANFTNLAEEYIRQNANNKYILKAFKNMNPLVQRVEILNNLKNIFENAGSEFIENYTEAENLSKDEADAIRSMTINNLKDEIEYLKENATKQDLEFQRYKDIYNVPYWTNKAMDDFLQKGVLPIGSETVQADRGIVTPFYKGATDFGAFMMDYKYDPLSDEPEEDRFYNKVKSMYNKKPFEDRFSKAPLAERFANKVAMSNRELTSKLGGTAVRITQFPYLNTIEQARQAGAISPESYALPSYKENFNIPLGNNPILNAGEMVFDASALASPLFKLGRGGLLLQSAGKGALIGAKSALEGEEKAVPTNVKDMIIGASIGGGVGGAAYKAGKYIPRFLGGGKISKQIESLGKQIRTLKEPSVLRGELEDTKNLLSAIKTRDEMFGKEALDGIGAYARRYNEPVNPGAVTSNDVAKQALNQQMTFMEYNPLFYTRTQKAPYEVGFSMETPVQNTPLAPVYSYETPQGQFFKATGYGSGIGIPLGSESETRQALANVADYYANNEKFANALKQLGVDVSDEMNKVNVGSIIGQEINAYADEPIAKALITKSSKDDLYNIHYPEWLKRNNLPNNESSKALFEDKFKMAQVNFREGTTPEKLPSGRVEDTKVFNKILKKVNSLSSKTEKARLINELNKAKNKGLTLEELSKILNKVSSEAGGVNSDAYRYAATLRKEMSPNVVLRRTFDRAKGVMEAEKKIEELPKKIAEGEKLLAEKQSLEEFKKGFSPVITSFTNKASASASYGTAKGHTRSLAEDYGYVPVTEESVMYESTPNQFPYNFINPHWDSPFKRMRYAGSFNIPKGGK